VTDCNFAGNSALGVTTTRFLNDPNDPNTVVIITDDSPVGVGGGIYCNSDSSITVNSTVFKENSAEDGGGLYFDADALGKVVDCNITENTAARGGGLFYVDCPDSSIVGSTINNNEAARIITTTEYYIPDSNDPNASPIPILPTDPAFDANDPDMIILDLQDRSGIGQGGGIYSFAGPTLIEDCQINYE
jgi:predicted outer membrane repeat protein